MQEIKAMLRKIDAIEEQRAAAEERRHKQQMRILYATIILLTIFGSVPYILWILGVQG
jgi:hypothetical protein